MYAINDMSASLTAAASRGTSEILHQFWFKYIRSQPIWVSAMCTNGADSISIVGNLKAAGYITMCRNKYSVGSLVPMYLYLYPISLSEAGCIYSMNHCVAPSNNWLMCSAVFKYMKMSSSISKLF